MRMRSTALLTLTALAVLVGCGDTYQDQSERLIHFVENNQVGSASDVWLVKLNAFGQLEKVALFFAFTDDLELCREMAELYMERHPVETYQCEMANDP